MFPFVLCLGCWSRFVCFTCLFFFLCFRNVSVYCVFYVLSFLPEGHTTPQTPRTTAVSDAKKSTRHTPNSTTHSHFHSRCTRNELPTHPQRTPSPFSPCCTKHQPPRPTTHTLQTQPLPCRTHTPYQKCCAQMCKACEVECCKSAWRTCACTSLSFLTQVCC